MMILINLVSLSIPYLWPFASILYHHHYYYFCFCLLASCIAVHMSIIIIDTNYYQDTVS